MSPFQMIPAQIDVVGIVKQLHALGWSDYKLEIATGLGKGYIAQCRIGNIRSPAYDKAARLYNFWVQETSVASSARVVVRMSDVGPLSATSRST